ncbi:response regulator transcription factor [Paenibacillus macquariensis]|uniref:Two-component system, OmpR family, response regulator CssR n=1 Tax=Paenibacillus macquariensis TaxID=948756 RepID=A0ABY1K5S8_9BACL|nr:response regulator transcription factor [Paenibacillus macquariensis]MEC0090496.1 response regulator transcription factor [Paenibacillus macquariensis]OAB38571.1 DNA-binding response regulator [Paenibacillus macquariensis subsp. macquariensis]SIR30165.1 two-component system, OmpR family, response regulator CssR [Paenibacillus macquariensis]
MNKDYLIAVVDDDQHIRNLVEAYLIKENYQTIGLGSAEEAWTLWQTNPPDMWVLDIMLPGMDGYEFCRRIRHEAEVPIIMISARDNEVDKILGLELGSDDYMVKPFSPRELVARIKRQLQRTYKMNAPTEGVTLPTAPASLEVGRLQLLLEERRVFWCREEVDLTSKEFTMLKVFADSPNRAFTRDELLTFVWGDDYFGSDRAVDHLIKRMRKKLEHVPIEAVWGHGYRMRAEEGEQTDEASTSN